MISRITPPVRRRFPATVLGLATTGAAHLADVTKHTASTQGVKQPARFVNSRNHTGVNTSNRRKSNKTINRKAIGIKES